MPKTVLQTFYDRTRSGKLLGPVLTVTEVEGLQAILSLCMARKLGAAHTAYILATAYHETAGTMQPVHEIGGVGYLTRLYDIKGSRPTMAKRFGNTTPGDGIRYCGRGLIQITWKCNYDRIGKLLGVDLVNHPERAQEMDIAARIAVDGMIGGWFTGRKLSHTIKIGCSGTREAFQSSRQIINGTDKAALIASYALIFQNDLLLAGWTL